MKIRASKAFDSFRTARYGKYNEVKLLGIEQDSKKRGLNKLCPICSTLNFITFKPPVKNKEGEVIISRINWVTCSKCNTAYGLE